MQPTRLDLVSSRGYGRWVALGGGGGSSRSSRMDHVHVITANRRVRRVTDEIAIPTKPRCRPAFPRIKVPDIVDKTDNYRDSVITVLWQISRLSPALATPKLLQKYPTISARESGWGSLSLLLLPRSRPVRVGFLSVPGARANDSLGANFLFPVLYRAIKHS
jgi:hypothetical protein